MSDPRRWRVGQHYSIHVYAIDPTDTVDSYDEPVCTALTLGFAQQIVHDHNQMVDLIVEAEFKDEADA